MLNYPETRRVDQVDTYHGMKVADPVSLAGGRRPRVARGRRVGRKKQNAGHAHVSRQHSRSGRNFKRRLTELWNYERYSAPIEEGGAIFLSQERRPAESGRAVRGRHVRRRGPRAARPEQVVGGRHDRAGRLSRRATTASYLAYARIEAGSDWRTIYVIDVETGKQLADQLKWARFSDIAWNADGSGFYYTAIPSRQPGEQYQSAATNQMIYFHKLGTNKRTTSSSIAGPDHPDWSFGSTDRRRQVPRAVDQSQHRSAEPGLGCGRSTRRSTPVDAS